MSITEVVPILVRMGLSFIAAFGAIAVWSKSRDSAWVFMVLGAIFYFVDAMYETLVIIGIATYRLPFGGEFPLLESVLTGLPPFFLAVGFLVFLLHHRRY